jgi:ATP-dependent DNA ligase
LSFHALMYVLEDLEGRPRGNERLEALKEADSPELRKLLNYAISKYITFGVKQLPPVDINGSGSLQWETVTYVLDRLATRELSGNDAKEHIAELFEEATTVERKWLERIIKQDLRLDLDASSVNKALPGCIPMFKISLAVGYDKVKPADLKGLWTLQPKLDGGRCVAFLPKDCGQVILLSRNGKPWYNFETVRRELQQLNEELPSNQDRYLDGEVISIHKGRIDFQAIQKTMHAKSRATEIGDLKYFVFDGAYADEWENPRQPYLERLDWATSLVQGMQTCKTDSLGRVLQVLPENVLQMAGSVSDLIKDPTHEDLVARCKEYVERGFEGAMLRQVDAPVVMKRSKSLIKVKLFQDAEALIVGAVSGKDKYVGMLGALRCTMIPSGVQFEVGSGFSDLGTQGNLGTLEE